MLKSSTYLCTELFWSKQMKLVIVKANQVGRRIKIASMLILLLTSSSLAFELPKQSSFFVMDGSCCGGEDSDPHAVHGFETAKGAFILSGKIIDESGLEDGFVVKVPHSLPEDTIFLHEEEEFNVDWSVKIGIPNKREGINAAAELNGAIFAGGYLENQRGIIESHLIKLDEATGAVVWTRSFPSEYKNTEGAIESIIRLSDNGLLIAGVKNSRPGTLEGFKSYGNPVTGDAYIMYFSEKQVDLDSAPVNPAWEIVLTGAKSVKHAEEIPLLDGYILAAHAHGEEATAKVIKISLNGQLQWELDIPNHGELTAIAATEEGYFLSGHKTDEFGGIDASISMISLNGKFVWNKTYGNPTDGNSIFSGLEGGDPKLIYDECWSITRFRSGLVVACGTGIEECEELGVSLRAVCEDDPRTTWRSYLIHIDLSGNLIWQRASSFTFDDDDDVPSTASEWVFTTRHGDLASVVDLDFGIGIEILK